MSTAESMPILLDCVRACPWDIMRLHYEFSAAENW